MSDDNISYLYAKWREGNPVEDKDIIARSHLCGHEIGSVGHLALV